MARYCFATLLCIALTNIASAQLSEDTATQNYQAGSEFLNENRAREGVGTLASGLQYEVLRRGDGARPEWRC